MYRTNNRHCIQSRDIPKSKTELLYNFDKSIQHLRSQFFGGVSCNLPMNLESILKTLPYLYWNLRTSPTNCPMNRPTRIRCQQQPPLQTHRQRKRVHAADPTSRYAGPFCASQRNAVDLNIRKIFAQFGYENMTIICAKVTRWFDKVKVILGVILFDVANFC